MENEKKYFYNRSFQRNRKSNGLFLSEVRFHGDKERAKKVYEGVEALKPEDIADVALYVANQPKHVQISDVTIMATKQATGFNVHREK